MHVNFSVKVYTCKKTMMINVRIHVVIVKEPWISSLSSNNEWNKSYRFYVIFMHDVWENPSNMPNIMITFTGSKHNHQSQIW